MSLASRGPRLCSGDGPGARGKGRDRHRRRERDRTCYRGVVRGGRRQGGRRGRRRREGRNSPLASVTRSVQARPTCPNLERSRISSRSPSPPTAAPRDVNNAGISSSFHRFLRDDLSDLHHVMAVNLYGVIYGSQCAARRMAENGSGSIVNTSSIGALSGGGPPIAYRTSKAAIIQFSRAIAVDLAEYGIRVNCIAPGHIPTDITHYDLGPLIRVHQPLQRQGRPRTSPRPSCSSPASVPRRSPGSWSPSTAGRRPVPR